MSTDVPTSPVDFTVGEDALIVRPDAEVEVRVVPPGGVAFVRPWRPANHLGSAAALGQSVRSTVRSRRQYCGPDRRGCSCGYPARVGASAAMTISGERAGGALARGRRGLHDFHSGNCIARAAIRACDSVFQVRADASGTASCSSMPAPGICSRTNSCFMVLRTGASSGSSTRPTRCPTRRFPYGFRRFGEILLPAALVIGFATRLSALGMLAMIIVIFLVFPQYWVAETLPWAAMALALIAYGPGRISFDFLIWNSWKRR